MKLNTRWAIALMIVQSALGACGSEEVGAAPEVDSGLGDDVGQGGGVGQDGSTSDSGLESDVVKDASPDQDSDAFGKDTGKEAESSAGEAGGCSVLGVAGECLDLDDCAALAEHTSTAGFCPGPANIQCCTPFGTVLCDPNTIQYPNESNTVEAAGEGGCPSGMIPVAEFCIDKYEASLVQVSDSASWSPYVNPGATAVRAVSVKGAVPQGYINQEQAAEACANAGKRLCTDDEWLRACQGPQGFTYPYGDSLELGTCNDHREVHPAVQYFGTSDDWIWSEIGNACLNQLPQSLQPCGSLPGCVTTEGALDMMGNLHEWTADPAGTFRGGFYVDTKLNGPGCLYATTAHNTLHWDYSTGFRCCSD